MWLFPFIFIQSKYDSKLDFGMSCKKIESLILLLDLRVLPHNWIFWRIQLLLCDTRLSKFLRTSRFTVPKIFKFSVLFETFPESRNGYSIRRLIVFFFFLEHVCTAKITFNLYSITSYRFLTSHYISLAKSPTLS